MHISPSPFLNKSLHWKIKSEGQPCEQGEAAAQTGCIPKNHNSESSTGRTNSTGHTIAEKVAKGTRAKISDSQLEQIKTYAAEFVGKLPAVAQSRVNEAINHVSLVSNAGWRGKYDPDSRTVQVNDSAWHVFTNPGEYVHTYKTTLVHEIGHGVDNVLTPEEKESWKKLSNMTTAADLTSEGVPRMRIPLPEGLEKMKEFKTGGIWDWEKHGWTYQGYKRANDAINLTRLPSGKLKVNSMSFDSPKTKYVKADRPGPTAYGTTYPVEEFAEAWTMYHVNPDGLKQREPAMHSWMEKWVNQS